MQPPVIRSATNADRRAVVDALTLAFADDPFNRWYLPEPSRYLEFFPQIVDGLLTPAIEAGSCYVTGDLMAAAIWYPPGVSMNEEQLGPLFERAARPDTAEELGTLLGTFEKFHPHDADCWYLPLIGVDPKGQGKGAGAALMKHATDAIDAQGALSYLESSTLKNISLYQRHGFDVMEHLPFGNDDGIATPMLRVRQS